MRSQRLYFCPECGRAVQLTPSRRGLKAHSTINGKCSRSGWIPPELVDTTAVRCPCCVFEVDISNTKIHEGLPFMPAHDVPHLDEACIGSGMRAARIGRKNMVERTQEAWRAGLICPTCGVEVQVDSERQDRGVIPVHERAGVDALCGGEGLEPQEVRLYPEDEGAGGGKFDRRKNKGSDRADQGSWFSWPGLAAVGLIVLAVLGIGTAFSSDPVARTPSGPSASESASVPVPNGDSHQRQEQPEQPEVDDSIERAVAALGVSDELVQQLIGVADLAGYGPADEFFAMLMAEACRDVASGRASWASLIAGRCS